MFRVTMSFGGKQIKRFTFDKAMIAIGRDATCDIVVENIGASRRHATIEKTPEGYILSDLKSHNGTFVGGSKVFHHQLKETDEFFIGKYAFQFETLEPVTVNAAAESDAAPAVSADMTFRLDRKDIERIIGHSKVGSSPQLVQIAPEGEKQNVVLEKAYCLIGAHESCEVRLAGLFTPGRAAVVIRGDHGFRVLGLSKKFRLNGKHVADGPLADGDQVQIGARRWRFVQA